MRDPPITARQQVADITTQNALAWIGAYTFLSTVAFGLGGLFRGIVAPIGILVAVPLSLATGVLQWNQGIRLLPDQAALSLVQTPAYEVLVIPPGWALITLLTWAVTALTTYVLTIRVRDT